MTAQQIFGLQVLLSFLVYGLVARWYVTPRLAPLPLHAALQPLLVLHATRYLGMVFLVPTVVGPALPAGFAGPGEVTAFVSFGFVTPGTHVVGVQAEGEVGGCNVGNLVSWAGKANLKPAP